MQALTLPGTAKAGWKFNIPAVREAVAFFELTAPVEVKFTAGQHRVGCHRWRNGQHVITVSGIRDAADASETLWHELTHAAQLEYLGSDSFHADYRREHNIRGYHGNRYEVEARETATTMTAALPLTKES